MIEFFVDHYQWVLVAFYVAEKVVKESKAKWDDILVDGIKSIAVGFYNLIGRP